MGDLANYPLDLAPGPPAPPTWPLAWSASTRGFYAFRSAYRDRDDVVLQIMSKPVTVHGWDHPDAGAFSLQGLDQAWAVSVEAREGRRVLESVVVFPDDALCKGLGQVLEQHSAPDGSGSLLMDLSVDTWDGQATGADSDYWGNPLPRDRSRLPLQHRRGFAFVASGASGAPLALAITDRIQGGGRRLWQWQFPETAVAAVLRRPGGFSLTQGDALLRAA